MGPGAALLDYDSDGDLDVYLLQGRLLDDKKVEDSVFPPRHPLGNRLFRNELQGGQKLSLLFSDVTEKAGVKDGGYGMGVAVGDFDNDGDPDIYLANFGHNVLYQNNGDGTFRDVTERAGVDDVRWSSSAAFLDFDRDADLDLVVVNYLDFTVAGNQACYDAVGARDYCHPSRYRPLPDRLFLNQGDGTFLDVTERAGITRAYGRGLGVACRDFNGDGWVDIYVANDGDANQLWINRQDGSFEDEGLISGTAYNVDGVAEAGMGIAAGDVDNDGDEDIFVTHFSNETNTFYSNQGQGNFADITRRSGLALPSFPYTGFGTEWLDYDNDGRLDLFVANGAVTVLETLRGDPYPYHQINQLFRNSGSGRFDDVTAKAGAVFDLSEVSRGAAFGDVDNDGDVDILLANNNGPVRLLLNQVGARNHWLMVRLEAVQGNRQGLGARVGVLRRGAKPLWRQVHTDGSYMSAGDAGAHFGLGTAAAIEGVVVQWPGGQSEVWSDVSVNSIVMLRQGMGRPWTEERGADH